MEERPVDEKSTQLPWRSDQAYASIVQPPAQHARIVHQGETLDRGPALFDIGTGLR
jgi:hypothetical protein